MRKMELTEGSYNDLEYIYELAKEDFAPEELKSYRQLRALMENQSYKFILAKTIESQEIVGYAFVYNLPSLNASWLDYLAITKEFRQGGYGSIFLDMLSQSKVEGYLGLFIEVEIPEKTEGATRQEQVSRIRFYEKNGAIRLKVDYKLPTENGAIPMYLYFKPSEAEHVPTIEQIKKGIFSAFEFIHSDYPHRAKVFEDIIPSII
ncbi:hypothetical protein AM500_22425 [Bacillus sp. FJAT-18017]|uniref:GNAT family N-acetyltransferase n=1 Tax=Bacillus sp. FJAT-18017 TaxID=1705566 RepID=UPI0006AFFF82|nr:GNAT family N-acetyltransferase [Bacillus sp. FJAT-18017]ALC92219.1 hypothetical protein AM500_22425 [Bacillus sp. FJAT-18017]